MNLHTWANLALSALCLASVATAQDRGADPKQLYAKKLEAEFLTKVPWSTDLGAARKTAKERGQVMLAYFTRSYAP